MRFPKTPLDIANEIQISAEKSSEIGDLRIRQLIHLLTKVPDDVIIEGILLSIENSGNNYLLQKFCGQILSELKPKPGANLILKRVLQRILPGWNKSVQEIPEWISGNFEKEKIIECFDELTQSDVLNDIIDNIETMLWWMKLEQS